MTVFKSTTWICLLQCAVIALIGWGLGLYFWGNRWTLAAWCELRQDYRSFRPDRIRELTLLTDRFDPGDGINLADFLARMDSHEGEAHGQKTA